MKSSEFLHIIAAIIVLSLAASFQYFLTFDLNLITQTILFSTIIICIVVVAQKSMAFLLDIGAEHRIWTLSRFGFQKSQYFKKEIPLGIIAPLILSLFTLGLAKIATILVYETKVLKSRAAKRFGYYSFTEMTEWHNALIGAAGIISALILSIIAYFLPMNGVENLSKLAIYYAVANMLPISDLNGTKIFFGSRILYITLSLITLIFFIYALVLK